MLFRKVLVIRGYAFQPAWWCPRPQGRGQFPIWKKSIRLRRSVQNIPLRLARVRAHWFGVCIEPVISLPDWQLAVRNFNYCSSEGGFSRFVINSLNQNVLFFSGSFLLSGSLFSSSLFAPGFCGSLFLASKSFVEVRCVSRCRANSQNCHGFVSL